MQQFYSPPGASAYPMISGLPQHFKGDIIEGSEQFHVIDNFGITVKQSVTTPLLSVTYQTVSWYHLQKIWNHVNYGRGLFTHIITDKKFIQVIKGIGEVELEIDQLISFTARSFTAAYNPKIKGTYNSILIWWSEEFLRSLKYDDLLYEPIKFIITGFAEKIPGPVFTLTGEMKEILNDLKGLNYANAGIKTIHLKMKRLARLILIEAREARAAKKEFSKSWPKISAIIADINANPFKEITEEQVCKDFKIGITTVRNGIKAFTGMGLIEYSNTVMFIRVARKVVFEDMLAKDILEQVGLSDVSSFCRAFKNRFGCKLTELNTTSWDTMAKGGYIISSGDKIKYGNLLALYMSGKIKEAGRNELNQWLLLREEHLHLFEQLLDDDNSKWTKQWFETAGIRADNIEWKLEGGWERPDPHGKQDQKNLKWYFLLCLLILALMELEIKYGIDGIMGFIKSFFTWIGIG